MTQDEQRARECLGEIVPLSISSTWGEAETRNIVRAMLAFAPDTGAIPEGMKASPGSDMQQSDCIAYTPAAIPVWGEGVTQADVDAANEAVSVANIVSHDGYYEVDTDALAEVFACYRLAVSPTPAPLGVEKALQDVRKFLRAVEDFGTISGGPFREKYPDQGPYEGYGFIQRWGQRLTKKLASLDAGGERG